MYTLISGLDPLLAVFLIAALGYLIGEVKIRDIKIGSSGILLIALLFGHFGCKIPSLIRNLGLALFVASIGFTAGPSFFRHFSKSAGKYVVLGAVIVLTGALICVGLIAGFGIRAELASGLLAGALTSTPGLAAAQDAAGDLAASVSIGYAIAYPFGVIGVVLFVQVVPKLLKINMKTLTPVLQPQTEATNHHGAKRRFSIELSASLIFVSVVTLGLLLGGISIPLPNGARFALGITGGPLFLSLLFGHLMRTGPFTCEKGKQTLETLRELGLMLFLIGAGVDGGGGFIATLEKEGAILLLYGAVMTLFPMLVGYVIATKWLKMDILSNLGSIVGGMTSTPALGALISSAGTDSVIGAYAATYPIALVLVVLCSQFVVVLFG